MDEISKAIELRDMLEDSDPDDRLEVFKIVSEGYCRACGFDQPCGCPEEYDD
jgi:hypothetical protein